LGLSFLFDFAISVSTFFSYFGNELSMFFSEFEENTSIGTVSSLLRRLILGGDLLFFYLLELSYDLRFSANSPAFFSSLSFYLGDSNNFKA